MEEKIITQCSGCQAQFKLDREKIGKKIRCPKCATIFVIEDATPKAAAPKVEAPKAAAPAADEKIIAQCSSCQAQFKLGRDKIGKKIKCPKCSGIFVVEEQGAEPEPAAKPSVSKPTPPPSQKKPAAPPAQQKQAAPVAPAVMPLEQRKHPLTVRDFLETQRTRLIPEKAQGVHAHISYTFTEKGEPDEHWTLILQNGVCEIREGADPSAKSQVTMKRETYLKLATDQLDGRVAFMLGKLKIKGDKTSLALVRECFQKTGLKDWK